MAKPTENHNQKNVLAFSNGDGMAGLIRLLKGKVQTNWVQTGDTFEISRVLLDEAYRQPFDDLVALIQHREAVVACLIHQRTARPPDVRR